MDLAALVRAVNSAFSDAAKLVTKLRNERADTDRALPEEPTQDLLDSLQLGPLLIKGQYDHDLKRFGEPFACGDPLAREQLKDVLINLQMALIISLRGGDDDLDFEALQQSSDDCRTNAGVCLGQLSQRLSDTAKAQAMIAENDMLRLAPNQALKQPPSPSLAYSSSRSTRSTRSSGRDPRTPPQSIHENFATTSVASNTNTIRAPVQPVQERKRATSSASRRGYQPKRPMTPQSQHISPNVLKPMPSRENLNHLPLHRVPSQEVLTPPPDEDTQHNFRAGRYAPNPMVSNENLERVASAVSAISSGSSMAGYSNRRQAGTSAGVASDTQSQRSYESRSRQAFGGTPSVDVPQQAHEIRTERRFGGINTNQAPVVTSNYDTSRDPYDISLLDDPTTSEDEEIMSLRRPSSHALGPDDMMSPDHGSPTQSFVVTLPEVDLDDHLISPISPVSEGRESDEDSIMPSPEILPQRVYQPNGQPVSNTHFDAGDYTPPAGQGEFGYVTVYETSRIRPGDSDAHHRATNQHRGLGLDVNGRPQEQRKLSLRVAERSRSATPVHHEPRQLAFQRQPEPRYYRESRTASTMQHVSSQVRVRDMKPHREEVRGYQEQSLPQQQYAPPPQHLMDMPLPAPPAPGARRPETRGSSTTRTPQSYKVFPHPPAHGRGAPAPPPLKAPPPPPISSLRYQEVPRPLTSPTLSSPPPFGELSRPVTSARATDLGPTTLVEQQPQPEAEAEPEPEAEEEEEEVEEVVRPLAPPVRTVKIVPLSMAMYGGTYVPPRVSKPKKPKEEKKPRKSFSTNHSNDAAITAPPMPLTLPLVLPTDKHLHGFCKGAYRTFGGQGQKNFSAGTRNLGQSGPMPIWTCGKCFFMGPQVVISKDVGKKKPKEEKIFDPKVRTSLVRGIDGQTGGVRYKWIFLAKCHISLKTQVDDLSNPKQAKMGETGSFGCLFCCAEGVQRGWVGSGFNNMHSMGGDGNGSIKSGSTGSGNTTRTSEAIHSTPIFNTVMQFMEHLEMHRREDGWPGAEMLGRMKCVVGRVAGEGEDWDINFMPVRNVAAT